MTTKLKDRIELRIATDNPYNDCPPSTHFLERQINEYLAEGFQLHGNPYMTTKGGNYPATFQMMIRYINQ